MNEITESTGPLAATTPSVDLVHLAGQAANQVAVRSVFADYLRRRARNTLRAQASDLAQFADFLDAAHPGMGSPMRGLAEAIRAASRSLSSAPSADAFSGVTWGLMEAFKAWMIERGEAVASINRCLSTVKKYAGLAFKAGVLSREAHALIKDVEGYSSKEAKRLNESRLAEGVNVRRGHKKAEHVSITRDQARKLKREQPNTPQGRRDALLMCLLLDHGLRCGEVARLRVGDFNLTEGTLKFYRPKVDKVQTHKLTKDTRRALRAWVESGDVPLAADAPLLRGSLKNSVLTDGSMSERAITERVRVLGETVELKGLSAHDCRHYWATLASREGTDPFRLQEAGGWSSLAMPRRYVEEARIANEGVKLGEDS